jgi:hypothetical protein
MGYYCEKCKRIQDTIAIYGDRVYEVVENVLMRTPDKQEHKIKNEIKKEIETKEYNLRTKKPKKIHIKRGKENSDNEEN